MTPCPKRYRAAGWGRTLGSACRRACLSSVLETLGSSGPSGEEMGVRIASRRVPGLQRLTRRTRGGEHRRVEAALGGSSGTAQRCHFVTPGCVTEGAEPRCALAVQFDPHF